jgi:D-beta-D-heptose 7-phosphate kinase/D-beta-D-heptose 1-phosphate adenosyltransferase
MQHLQDFSKTKVLVIGDIMLDRYWWGDVRRISPEAPVPVVELNNCTYSPGGAANVAVNIAGLGARPFLFGLTGEDTEADQLRTAIESSGVDSSHIVSVVGRQTTVKTRLVAHSQHVARIDVETKSEIDAPAEESLLSDLAGYIDDADAVVLSDYAKGLLTDGLLTEILTRAQAARKPVLVDPKGKNYRKYRGSTVMTPNRGEAADACSLDPNLTNLVELAGQQLLNELDTGAVLITQGEAGMTLFQRSREPIHFQTAARKVYDVTGAGDTVIATLATALGAGADLETATRLANIAAGIVVEQVGTSSISISDLSGALAEAD